MSRSPDLRPDNRGILIDALADGADVIAISMPAADRAAIFAQIQTVLPASDDECKRIVVVQSAFECKECEALCALSEQ